MTLRSRVRRGVLTALMVGITLPIILAVVVGAFLFYSWVFGINDTDPVPPRHVVGLILSMTVPPWCGFVIGFRLWLIVARHVLGFGRADVEPMVSGAETPPMFGRLFQTWVDRTYGPR